MELLENLQIGNKPIYTIEQGIKEFKGRENDLEAMHIYTKLLNFYGLTPIGFTTSGFACPLSAGRLHLQAYACSISGGINNSNYRKKKHHNISKVDRLSKLG